jgi:hypothetical protein
LCTLHRTAVLPLIALDVVRSIDRPDLEAQTSTTFRKRWPEFTFHDPIARAHHAAVERYFPDWEVWLVDHDRVIAGGWGASLRWDGTVEDLREGCAGSLVRSMQGHEAGAPANMFCLMGAAVAADANRKGLAGEAVSELRDRPVAGGLGGVIAPVRRSLKHVNPLVPIRAFSVYRVPPAAGRGLRCLASWSRIFTITGRKLFAAMFSPPTSSTGHLPWCRRG